MSNFRPVNALFLSISIILPVRLIMWEVLLKLYYLQDKYFVCSLGVWDFIIHFLVNTFLTLYWILFSWRISWSEVLALVTIRWEYDLQSISYLLLICPWVRSIWVGYYELTVWIIFSFHSFLGGVHCLEYWCWRRESQRIGRNQRKSKPSFDPSKLQQPKSRPNFTRKFPRQNSQFHDEEKMNEMMG